VDSITAGIDGKCYKIIASCVSTLEKHDEENDACSEDINLLAIGGLLGVDLLNHVAFNTEDGSSLYNACNIAHMKNC
jgi:hypothetical protein